jgi:uncharacterized DUF497 family protein
VSLSFEWDPAKSASNRRKHGVTFDEAQTVFYDEDALLGDDPDHSEHEARFVLLGLSSTLRMLLVCHCVRQSGTVIRIISARKASRHEQRQYRSR